MATKVYKLNNVLILDDGVKKQRINGNLSSYDIDNATLIVWENGNKERTFSTAIADVQDQSGTPVGNEAAIDTYMSGITNFKTAGGGSPAVIGSNLTKSGQTISYATGDDGDLQSGRGVDFTTLSVDNPHGTRDRFTDELGTQVYTNNIMIDWTTYDGVTALGIHKTPSPSDTWANNVAYCLGLVVAGFGDWHMPNIQEAWNLANISLTGGHMFAWTPLNVTLVSNGIMTSNTYLYATHQFYLVYGNGTMSAFSKVGTWKTLPHRYFTKAELGL